jgi:hypothetical protein
MDAQSEYIPTPVRAQLLAAGIPASRHTHAGLLGLFPGELNVSATGLDAHDLAEVLVYLSARGLLGLSGTGLGSVKKVQPGWHFCTFYRDNQQLLNLIAPYIVEGLKAGEGCFWVMPATATRDAACNALSRSLPNVNEYLADGRLELGYHPEWYLDGSGRMKSFEEVAGALLQKQDQALAKGLQFLRAAGDAGWVSCSEESKSFIDYEMKVNQALGSTKVAAVCTFRAGVTADELVDIVTAHQDALQAA